MKTIAKKYAEECWVMVDSLVVLLEIMLINIILSGDNAVVIALASKSLPDEQRRKAVWWGTSGAVFLRVILTFAAVFFLQIPYIQAVGSLFLLYIAVKLITDDGGAHGVKEASNLIHAIGIIMAADCVMSLDNVLAIAAVADGNYIMIAIGIALSIPLIVWGSTLVMKLLNRYPLLIYAGAGILGYTAGEMLVKEERLMRLVEDVDSVLHWAVPVCAALFVVGVGVIHNGRKRRKQRKRAAHELTA
jgi:YjbE family integral membrane protein